MQILVLILFLTTLLYLTFLGVYLLSDYPSQMRMLNSFKKACATNDKETVIRLLNKQNFNPNRATRGKLTGLHLACAHGHIETVEILLAHPSISPNQTNSNGETPFYTACINNQQSLVQKLLQNELIDVNQANHRQTPFYATCYQAIMHGTESFKPTILTLLNSHRIAVNSTSNPSGRSALVLSSHYGEKELVSILLDNDIIDKHIRDTNGYTEIVNAAEHFGHTHVAKMIKEKYAPTDASP